MTPWQILDLPFSFPWKFSPIRFRVYILGPPWQSIGGLGFLTMTLDQTEQQFYVKAWGFSTVRACIVRTWTTPVCLESPVPLTVVLRVSRAASSSAQRVYHSKVQTRAGWMPGVHLNSCTISLWLLDFKIAPKQCSKGSEVYQWFSSNWAVSSMQRSKDMVLLRP